MAEVYEPDWRADERVHYTQQVADVLARYHGAERQPVDPELPLAFRPTSLDTDESSNSRPRTSCGSSPTCRPRSAHRPAGQARA